MLNFKHDEVNVGENNLGTGREECENTEHSQEEGEHEITLHTLTGWNVPKTMQIKATIGAH